MKKVFGEVAKAGADRVDIPDTVGFYPEYIAELLEIQLLKNNSVSVHCHNDFGLAVANALSGIHAGASCGHVTINGVGERGWKCFIGRTFLWHYNVYPKIKKY